MASNDTAFLNEIHDQSQKKQFLVVMRHGLRQDEVQSDWSSTSSRPWDPPLSSDGLEMVSRTLHALGPRTLFDPFKTSLIVLLIFCFSKARAAAVELTPIGIQKIVSSPFLRCYQTAKIVQKVLQLSDKALESDWQICEGRGYTHHLWEHALVETWT